MHNSLLFDWLSFGVSYSVSILGSSIPFHIVVDFLHLGLALVSKSHLLRSYAFMISARLRASSGLAGLSLTLLRLHRGWETRHSVEVRHACLPHRDIHHTLVVVFDLGPPVNSLDVVILRFELGFFRSVALTLQLQKHVLLVAHAIHFLKNSLLLLDGVLDRITLSLRIPVAKVHWPRLALLRHILSAAFELGSLSIWSLIGNRV